MAEVGIRELLEAGVHFGHQTRRWNPKMRRFIFGERGGIHIIDLQKTERAARDARRSSPPSIAARGGTVLFVGTKKQARDSVKEAAERAGMPYIDQRWLGGLLTNFQTISKRIKRLHDLDHWVEDGTLDLLPTRERIAAMNEREKLDDQPRRRAQPAAPARRDLLRRPEDRGDRRARGAAPEDPDHRPGRHERRPGPDDLPDPRQRRRDPLVQGDHRGDRRRGGASARPSSAPRRRPPQREREEQQRREAEEKRRREAEERARQEAEEQRRRARPRRPSRPAGAAQAAAGRSRPGAAQPQQRPAPRLARAAAGRRPRARAAGRAEPRRAAGRRARRQGGPRAGAAGRGQGARRAGRPRAGREGRARREGAAAARPKRPRGAGEAEAEAEGGRVRGGPTAKPATTPSQEVSE